MSDPEPSTRTLTRGFRGLADPVYAAAQATIVPGSAPLLGVRWPLVSAVSRKVDRALAGQSPAISVYLAEQLARAELREVRLFATWRSAAAWPATPSEPGSSSAAWPVARRTG